MLESEVHVCEAHTESPTNTESPASTLPKFAPTISTRAPPFMSPEDGVTCRSDEEGRERDREREREGERQERRQGREGERERGREGKVWREREKKCVCGRARVRVSV
jgi:hypothetical protein